LLPGTRRAGANGLFEVIAQLQGLDLPVIAWEGDILPQRVEGYRPAWLDELCLTGEVGWGRLYPPPRDVDRSRPMASITRVAPVSLFVRQDLNWLLSGTAAVDLAPLSGAARELLERLRERGASFAADLMQQTRLLATQIDDALGELVTRGIVTSDGFTGLRRLTRSAGEDPDVSATRRGSRSVTRRRSAAGVGRWSIWRPLADVGPPTGQDAAAKAASGSAVPVGRLPEDPRERREIVEQWAWQLLRRWGVVFRDLVQKETGGPSWWELAQTYRRLEAQGEIRGGRFVAGVAGEQFALGDTVRELRQLRGKEADGATSPGELVVLSAADPLNITGILGPEARVPARPSNVVALLDGELVAHIDAGTLIVHPTCPEAWREPVRSRLNRCVSPESAAEQTSADQFLDRHARRFARKRRTKPPDAPSGIPRPIIS
jgi:ATP-dependent Lhr-like helicase